MTFYVNDISTDYSIIIIFTPRFLRGNQKKKKILHSTIMQIPLSDHSLTRLSITVKIHLHAKCNVLLSSQLLTPHRLHLSFVKLSCFRTIEFQLPQCAIANCIRTVRIVILEPLLEHRGIHL